MCVLCIFQVQFEDVPKVPESALLDHHLDVYGVHLLYQHYVSDHVLL